VWTDTDKMGGYRQLRTILGRCGWEDLDGQGKDVEWEVGTGTVANGQGR